MIQMAAGLLAIGLGAAHPADPDDPLLRLPRLEPLRPFPVAAVAGSVEDIGPGVRMIRGQQVLLAGAVMRDQGPADGLEVLACLHDGKNHETLIRLEATSGQLVKAACIAALGLPDGEGAAEGSGQPARGTPVALTVRWRDQDGRLVTLPASCLVRDRTMDRPYPPLPYAYTGSRFLRMNVPDPTTGTIASREVFMLDSTRSLAVNYDEPDALLASPFPGAGIDVRFEVYSGRCPAPGTPVEVVIAPVTLPLTISMDVLGRLHGPDGAELQDAGLERLLAAGYGAGTSPAWRAVAVRAGADVPRSADVPARTRLLAAAARAGAWVVPVFTP